MTKDELIEKTDKAIQELVYPKYDLQKAYNYYNGIRDSEQFRCLEEIYGTNTPTTLHFTPLIKKHVDALINEYSGMPVIPKIFCKDEDTISNIERDKQLKIYSELHQYLKNHLRNSILQFINGKDINDAVVEQQLKDIQNDINNNFISDYEIAAQDIIEYIMQSRDIDFDTVLKDLFLDVLAGGVGYYKVEPTIEKNNIRLLALNPLNTFPDVNYENPYVKNSQRCVVRHWLSRTQVLNKYGKKLSKKDIETLETKWQSVYDNAMHYVRLNNSNGMPLTSGINAGVEVTPGYPDQSKVLSQELIPVYEVEWIETDSDFVMHRYETIRIGEEIYILTGKSENVIRSINNPSFCQLSVNGVYFLNRGVKPYSLILACTHLQD